MIVIEWNPGHVSALLAAYPEFGAGSYEIQDRWGIFNEVLCAGNDAMPPSSGTPSPRWPPSFPTRTSTSAGTSVPRVHGRRVPSARRA